MCSLHIHMLTLALPIPPQGAGAVTDSKDKPMEIVDLTEEGLRILRRTIYLTIMSSASFEECAHKLLKVGVNGMFVYCWPLSVY